MSIDADFLQKALDTGRAQGSLIERDGVKPFFVIPQNYKVEYVQDIFLTKPQRLRQSASFLDVPSFTHYVTDFGSDDTRIFVDPGNDTQKPQILAILDYHKASVNGAAATWGEHLAKFELRETQDWHAWALMNNKEHNQEVFAEFIEDNLNVIIEPSQAHMLAIAKEFQVKSDVKFLGKPRAGGGSYTFSYEENVRGATQKGEVAFPERFRIMISPYEGMAPLPITAKFSFRISEDGLFLKFKLLQLHKIRVAAFTEIVGQINQGINTGLILMGRPA